MTQNNTNSIVAVAHAIARNNNVRVCAETHSRYYTKVRNIYIPTHTYTSSASISSDAAAVSKQHPDRSSPLPSTSVSSYSSVHTWHTSKWYWLASIKNQSSLRNGRLLCDPLPPWHSPPPLHLIFKFQTLISLFYLLNSCSGKDDFLPLQTRKHPQRGSERYRMWVVHFTLFVDCSSL